jgi:hypothetical protein
VLAEECGMDMDNARAIAERITEVRDRAIGTPTMWRIGPLRIDNRLSVTGVLTVALALGAVVGGWYKFDFRIQAIETTQAQLQMERNEDLEWKQRIVDSLNSVDKAVGMLRQRLDDSQIGKMDR